MKKWERWQAHIDKINECLKNNIDMLIGYSENRYNEQLESVAKSVVEHSKECSILLVSGPSASTKTTTAYKLSEAIEKDGVNTIVVSLDNFFFNRDELPLLENGEKDYESINTVDLETLHRCFNEIIKNGESNFPVFDFTQGMRSKDTQYLKTDENTIIIVEGIHALRPEIAMGHDKNNFLKVYISPHTNFLLNDEIILDPIDIRFIRRSIRDYNYRNNSLNGTIDMWENVLDAEKENIYKYKNEADYQINSTIYYEPCIYKKYFNDLIEISEISEKNKSLVEKIKKALDNFDDMPENYVPKNSVLHEFIKINY